MTWLRFSTTRGVTESLHQSPPWWVIDLSRFEFKFRTVSVVLLHLSCSCGESCLLISWCAGDRCGMVDSDKDCGRSMRPSVKDRRWLHTGWVLGDRTIERSSDAVCGLYCAQGDEERGFLGWASKPSLTVYQWFDLKTNGTVCQWFSIKTAWTVFSGFTSKSVVVGFSLWASKPTDTVWWFVPQNHHSCFLVWASKASRQRCVGCVTKLSCFA
jgi:hypothetical protein